MNLLVRCLSTLQNVTLLLPCFHWGFSVDDLSVFFYYLAERAYAYIREMMPVSSSPGWGVHRGRGGRGGGSGDCLSFYLLFPVLC